MLCMYPETVIRTVAIAAMMVLLVAASVSDLRSRRVPDPYWIAGSIVLLPLAAIRMVDGIGAVPAFEYLAGASILMLYALSERVSGRVAAIPLAVAITMMIMSARQGGPVAPLPLFIMFTLMYRTGVLAGGADAKCLMLIALAFPYPFDLGAIEGEGITPPALETLLIASVLGAASVPLVCLLRGSGLRHPTTYPKNVADVDTAFEWPAERMEGSQRVWCRPFPDEADAIMDEFRSLGAEMVRVTPVVPFIVPLAAGFALTVLLGDPFALFI